MNLFSETAGLAVGIVQIKYTVAVFFCSLVKFFCSIFDLFAGLTPLYYRGGETKLLSVLFANKGVLFVYWCMAFCGIAMALTAAVSETLKRRKKAQGKSFSAKALWKSLIGCSLCMALLTISVTIILHYAALLLGQIGFHIWSDSSKRVESERTFTEEELAVMAKTLAVIGNYAASDSYNGVYNLNACYNEIRPNLLWSKTTMFLPLPTVISPLTLTR